MSAVLPPALPLVMQQDALLSWGLLFKVVLVLAVLLGLTYFGLRCYMHLAQRAGGRQIKTETLRCETSLRLSQRTRAFLLQCGEQRLLVVESGTMATVSLLPALPAALPVAQPVTLPAMLAAQP